MTQWLQFITYRPKVILLGRNGETDVVRDNETLATFNAIERVPDRLKNEHPRI
jgi:diaminopimelate decarboxylase